MKLFISHASEDKTEIARPLAEELVHRGFEVWYDEFSLKLGDSLRDSIDKGLIECDFGVVILSKNFFNKNWTKKELNGLISKEVGYSKKFILPIWHNITHQEVIENSVILADLIAIKSDSGINEVVKAIERATSKKDYNIPALQSECRKIARYFSQYLFSVWGGAVQWTPEFVAVFGNDGYISEDGEETKSFGKVQKFRSEIKARNIKELAFGTDSDGFTWSMIVEYGKARIIHELLWKCMEYNEAQRINAITNLTSMDESFYETSDIFRK
jgi:hypothetical protein